MGEFTVCEFGLMASGFFIHITVTSVIWHLSHGILLIELDDESSSNPDACTDLACVKYNGGNLLGMTDMDVAVVPEIQLHLLAPNVRSLDGFIYALSFFPRPYPTTATLPEIMSWNAVSIPDGGTTKTTTPRCAVLCTTELKASTLLKALPGTSVATLKPKHCSVEVCSSIAEPCIFVAQKKKRAEFRNELFHSLLSPAALPTSTLQSLTSTAACSRLALLNFCATVWFARFNTTSRQFQGGKGTGCLQQR